jgi:hypothetical protein
MIDRDDDINGFGIDYGQFERAEASDYCQHGVYVGGCGVDFMCGYCEMGADTWVEHTYYRNLVVMVNPDTGIYPSLEGGPFYTQEQAEAGLGAWETPELAPYLVALVVWPVVSGYWSDGREDAD